MKKKKKVEPVDQHSRQVRCWAVMAVDSGDGDLDIDTESVVVAFNCANPEDAVREAIAEFSLRGMTLPTEWQVSALKGLFNRVFLDYWSGVGEQFKDCLVVKATTPNVLPDDVLDTELQKVERRLLELTEESKRRSGGDK